MGNFVSALGNFVWSPVMCAILLILSVFFTARSGFFQFKKFPLWMKGTIGAIKSGNKNKKNAITPFQALCTALAATIGTGNIVGVAVAIYSGGPGAVFWMWVSALFGMMTKFFEIALAVGYRYMGKDGQWIGGPMVYIEKGLHCRWLAVIYAVLCLGASLGVGAGVQSNSVSSAMETMFGVKPCVTGIVLSAVSAAVIFGGAKRISAAAEKIVPAAAILYILGSLVLIGLNFTKLPEAILAIFRDAFAGSAVRGGILGVAASRAVRFGISRGISSNEAGIGSSAMAHSSAEVKSGIDQAMWGCFEVFVDTIVICTMTALVILTSGIQITDCGMNGAAITIRAFVNGFGDFAGIGIAAAIALFAFTTIIGWSHYGRTCCRYLGGERLVPVYNCIVILAVFLGCIGTSEMLWDISDALNGLMCVPNLIGVTGLSGVVCKMLREYFSQKEKILKKA